MNAQLKARLLKPRPRMKRVAFDNLVESMDWCDATRSHERTVHMRLSERHFTRRLMRRSFGWLFVATAVAALVSTTFPH